MDCEILVQKAKMTKATADLLKRFEFRILLSNAAGPFDPLSVRATDVKLVENDLTIGVSFKFPHKFYITGYSIFYDGDLLDSFTLDKEENNESRIEYIINWSC